MFEELKSVQEVVERLGGNMAVASITGSRHSSAVSNWKKLGKFPPKTYFGLKAALQERSLDAPDDLWKREPAHV
jgi:predicted SpoU family rRNA methylase